MCRLANEYAEGGGPSSLADPDRYLIDCALLSLFGRQWLE